MSEKTVSTEDLSKALEQLQDLAKGHNSRGTATTHVETMRDAGVGAGSDAGSTQVHHTPANSDPGSWAGSEGRRSPDNGATDGVDENGTDLRAGSAEMVKSVLAKAAAGETLDAVEQAILTAAIEKGGMFTNFSGTGKKSMDKKDEKEEVEKAKGHEDEEEDKKMLKEMGVKKSLAEAASENDEVSKGLELSSFLQSWVEVQDEALRGVSAGLSKSLSDAQSEQREVYGELTKSIAGLAEVLTLQAQRIEQLESTPARGPKSATAVEKSFGAGGAAAPEGEQLNKSQVLETMTAMVQSGKLNAQEVIKFEATGNIDPALHNQVLAYRSGR